MARGWESKSVESQIDQAEAAKAARMAVPKTPAEAERDSKRNGLMLTRTRVLRDLQTACNAKYRLQLQDALAYIDGQIADLES